MKKILFTGGGSAGHVLPNVAIIEELLAQGKTELYYMGTDGIEKGLISPLKIPYATLSCPKLVRGGGLSAWKNNLKIPLDLYRATQRAKKELRALRPDLVFSKGGYVSLPVVFAAKSLKIPCLAHESDLSVGLANKISASRCRRLLTSFPETAKRKNAIYVGAPIRRGILQGNGQAARRAWGIGEREKVLLVFGGGSGSRVLNDAVRKGLKTLTERYLVLHACGKGNEVECNLKNYRQFPFISDMGGAYACADLVVARAGAGTIFELLALKKPALLIPLEGATRGDQKQNAEYFARKGLCRILPQARLDELAEAIDETEKDEGLKRRLLESQYAAGNERILQEIQAALYE